MGLLALMMAVLTACGQQVSVPDDPITQAGGDVYLQARCAYCHGVGGNGASGPALSEVLTTFPSCEAQLRWVSLGSAGWRQEVGPTYGATDKPVKGGMPGFREELSDDQLRRVVVYVRVVFASLTVDAARDACDV